MPGLTRKKSRSGLIDYSRSDPRMRELDQILEAQKRAGIKDDDDEVVYVSAPTTPRERMKLADERPVTEQQYRRILELREAHYRQDEIAVQVPCQLAQVRAVCRLAGKTEREQEAKERVRQEVEKIARGEYRRGQKLPSGK